MLLKAALTLILPPSLLFCGTAHGQTAAAPVKPSLRVPAKRAAAMSGSSVVDGPVATGGGLYPVKNGRPVSFAEAGYIFNLVESKVLNPEFQSYYKITPETKKALRQILSELPPVFDLELAFDKIVGDRTAFIRQDKVNAKVLSEIQSVYSKVIASFGQKLDLSATVLAAYSKEDKTYILPPFQDGDENETPRTPHLNEEQRALNLIHEFKMRGNDKNQSMEQAQERLKRALQFDYLIHSYRHSDKSEVAQLKFIEGFKVLAPELLNWMTFNSTKNSAIARLIGNVEKKLGRPLLFSEIVGRPSEVRYRAFNLDRNLVHDFDSLIPNISNALATTRLHSVMAEIIRERIHLESSRDFNSEVVPTIPRTSSVDDLIHRAESAKRADEVLAAQCQQYAGSLAASDVKGNRLVHYDEMLDRVLLLQCDGPDYDKTNALWAE